MIPMEDAGLLRAARRMDQEALEAIFDQYASPLYSFALRLCNDALVADYVVADVFAKLLEHLSRGNGPSTNLRSYLYQTTYHLIVDEIRSSRRHLSLDVVDFVRENQDPLGFATEHQIMLKTLLQTVRRSLTRDQWHVVVLRFVEGLSLRETATIMKKEVGNVKVIQSRAVGILRKALNREDLEIRSKPSENRRISL